MRGEFIRGDGLVIPNNVTIFGTNKLLGMLFQQLPGTLYVGLCSGVYSPTVTTIELTEPTLGVGGYHRLEAPRGLASWPTQGTLNGESFVESADLIFVPTAAAFDEEVSRLFISDSAAGTGVMMLGGAFPAAVTLTPMTPIAQRTFRYRFYLR